MGQNSTMNCAIADGVLREDSPIGRARIPGSPYPNASQEQDDTLHAVRLDGIAAFFRAVGFGYQVAAMSGRK